MRDLRSIAAAVAVLASLGACSDSDPEPGVVAETSNRTLAATIADAPGLTTLATALTDAGLGDIFDGPGSYTLLAPGDDAFTRLDSSGEALSEPARRAELVAVLRGHILPGHLTPDAIRKAIAEKNGPVTMRTLADGTVTFSAEGDAITATGADGAKARIDGEALVATNGVVLPLDGLLKAPAPIPAS